MFVNRYLRYRPFPSCLLPLCQNEASYEIIPTKIVFPLQVHFHANEIIYRIKSFVSGLVLYRGAWHLEMAYRNKY